VNNKQYLKFKNVIGEFMDDGDFNIAEIQTY